MDKEHNKLDERYKKQFAYLKNKPIAERKHKIFWKNFLGCLLFFIGAVFIFSIRFNEAEKAYFDFWGGYDFVSFFCILYLCYKISRHFVKYEQIEELIKKKNITRKEFREKHGEILDIYN